jgi:hypothetical protein
MSTHVVFNGEMLEKGMLTHLPVFVVIYGPEDKFAVNHGIIESYGIMLESADPLYLLPPMLASAAVARSGGMGAIRPRSDQPMTLMPRPNGMQTPGLMPNLAMAARSMGMMPNGMRPNMSNYTVTQMAQFANQLQAQMIDANHRPNGMAFMPQMGQPGMMPFMPLQHAFRPVSMTSQSITPEEATRRQMDSLMASVKEAPPLPETEPSMFLTGDVDARRSCQNIPL